MSWWFGYRERYNREENTKPGTKCLSDSFRTRDEAKAAKNKMRKVQGLEFTDLFEAESKAEAKQHSETEPFSIF